MIWSIATPAAMGRRMSCCASGPSALSSDLPRVFAAHPGPGLRSHSCKRGGVAAHGCWHGSSATRRSVMLLACVLPWHTCRPAEPSPGTAATDAASSAAMHGHMLRRLPQAGPPRWLLVSSAAAPPCAAPAGWRKLSGVLRSVRRVRRRRATWMPCSSGRWAAAHAWAPGTMRRGRRCRDSAPRRARAAGVRREHGS